MDAVSVVFGLSLVTNENVRGYQLQMKADGNYPMGFIAKQVVDAQERKEDHITLAIGSVVNVKNFKQLFYDIVQLERIGFKPVGRGSEYHPDMVLDNQRPNLEEKL